MASTLPLFDTGSKSWTDVQKDKYQYDFQPSFPATSPARTTFYAREADDEQKFDRLFALQHGRGHTYEGWVGQRVRQEDEFTHRRALVILSQADITGWVRDKTIWRLTTENLSGFSRYYEGIDGACLGFATLYLYPALDEALESYLVDTAEELIEVDGEKLLKYVWGKYNP